MTNQEILEVLTPLTAGEKLAALAYLWSTIPTKAQEVIFLTAGLFTFRERELPIVDHDLGALLTAWPGLPEVERRALSVVINHVIEGQHTDHYPGQEAAGG